jgi:hypothetical protein
MDIAPVHEALNMARGLVLAHGLVTHMSPNSKRGLISPLTETQLEIKIDLQVETVKDDADVYGWWSQKYVCSFIFGYQYGENYQNEQGGLSKVATRFAKFQWMSGETDLSGWAARDKVVQSMRMLAEMLLVSTPEKITLEVSTPDETRAQIQRDLEQTIGSALHRHIPFSSICGLRVGGKARAVRLEGDSLVAVAKHMVPGSYTYEVNPSGSYRYRRNTRLIHRSYVIKVLNADGLLNVRRVA